MGLQWAHHAKSEFLANMRHEICNRRLSFVYSPVCIG